MMSAGALMNLGDLMRAADLMSPRDLMGAGCWPTAVGHTAPARLGSTRSLLCDASPIVF